MTNLKLQKRLAAEVLDISPKRIWIDPTRSDEVKESITKADIRNLINNKVIIARPKRGISRFRARKIKIQKSKGRRKGPGSRKGSRGARLSRKRAWIYKIKALRKFIKELKQNNLIENKAYRELMVKSKGGFFRSVRHVKLYIQEHSLIKGKK